MPQRSYNFTAQIDEIIKKNEKAFNVLIRLSLQELINIAQTPGISARSVKLDIAAGIALSGKRRSKKRFGPITMPQNKGGKMRVDTGFLRASGQAQIGAMPTGPVRGEPDKKYEYKDGPVSLIINDVKAGDVFYFGWTANYAKYREAYDGFLEGAVQQWPQIVARIADDIRGKIK